MVHNPEKLEMATYYRKRGFSYSEIAKLCEVSKGTVSNWLAKKKFSKSVKEDNIRKAVTANKARLALINKAKQSERDNRYKEAVRSAETEFKHYQQDPLFIAGLMLYAGVGDNKDRAKLRIANAQPDVHRIFISFLKTYMGVEKSRIRFWLLLYPDLNESQCERVWLRKLKLAKDNCHKHQVIQGKSNKRTLQYGVGNTIIVDTVLKHKLNRWIELALKKL